MRVPRLSRLVCSENGIKAIVWGKSPQMIVIMLYSVRRIIYLPSKLKIRISYVFINYKIQYYISIFLMNKKTEYRNWLIQQTDAYLPQNHLQLPSNNLVDGCFLSVLKEWHKCIKTNLWYLLLCSVRKDLSSF